MRGMMVVVVLLTAIAAPLVYAIDPPEYVTEWHINNWPLGIDVAEDGTIWVSQYQPGNIVSHFDGDGMLLGTLSTPYYFQYGVAAGEHVYVGFAWDAGTLCTNDGCTEPDTFCPFVDGSPLSGSHGVALDTDGNVYAMVTATYLQKFTPGGDLIREYPEIQYPQDIGVDGNGNIFFIYDGYIHKTTPDGVPITQWNGENSPGGPLQAPDGMGLDPWGNVYIADTYHDQVQVFDNDGNYLTHWGERGSGPGQFWFPEDVAVDAYGGIYVTEASNHRVQKFGYPASAVPDQVDGLYTNFAIGPNPVHEVGTLRFDLMSAQPITVEVLDVAGRLVATPYQGRLLGPGAHQLTYSPTNGSGMFFLRLTAGGQQTTTKFLVVR